MNSAASAPSLKRSLIKYAIYVLVMSGILVLVSGRPEWSRAWLFAGCVAGAQVFVGVLLRRRAPDLLVERSRIQAGTKSWDKVLAPIIVLVGPLALWVTAALDVRAHWPPPIAWQWSAAGFAGCLFGIWLAAWAMLTNRFFAATVRIQSDRGHVVVDGGPYRYVRHPGYVGMVVFNLASPLALGSRLATVPAIAVAIVLIVRTALEDRTLQAELDGFRAYTSRVPNRLLPGVW